MDLENKRINLFPSQPVYMEYTTGITDVNFRVNMINTHIMGMIEKAPLEALLFCRTRKTPMLKGKLARSPQKRMCGRLE